MRDELLYLGAATSLNVVVYMNFRIPDERFNVLLLMLPTFAAAVVGIPMWLYLTVELDRFAGVCVAILPFLVVPEIERVASPSRRIGASWAATAFGLVCAHFAVRAAFWI